MSSVSEEKVEVLRRYEQEKINKILSKYVEFCGKVWLLYLIVSCKILAFAPNIDPFVALGKSRDSQS